MFYELRQLYCTYSKTDPFRSKKYIETMYHLHKAFFDIKTEMVFVWSFLFACMELAVFHANCGDKEKAFEYLEEYAEVVENHKCFYEENLESKSKIFPQCTTSLEQIDYDIIKRIFTARKGLNSVRNTQRFRDILKRLKILE